VNGLADTGAKMEGERKGLWRTLVFPLSVIVLYVVLFAMMPSRTISALQASGQILIQIALPLCVAFIIMFALNLFIKPANVSRFLGKGAGVKGVIISGLAGIIATGPIYAWYALLKELRDKGASEFHIANFLCNRAVKPFLLPVMIAYFGWAFTLVLNILLVVGAIVTALVVNMLSTLAPRR